MDQKEVNQSFAQNLYTTKTLAIVAGGVATGSYILGHTRGEKRGYLKGLKAGVTEGLESGRLEGYVRAIADYATLLREASND